MWPFATTSIEPIIHATILRPIIRSWCCLSGADVGEFESLGDGLEAVLSGAAVKRAAAAPVVQLHRASAVVTDLRSRFGSAA